MEAVKSPPEQRIVLRNISWETYERLLAEREEDRVPRFTYDRGVLEIMSPSAEHEEIADLTASLIRELAVAWEIDMRAVGHTTFRREFLDRGFGPDGSFYLFGNAALVRGKADLDLDAGDPPPDLVVEVNRTSHSLDKLPIYARLGVPEVWRYVVGRGPARAKILALESQAREVYEPIAESRLLPPLTSEALARFVEAGRTKELAIWAREVREWAQGRLPGS